MISTTLTTLTSKPMRDKTMTPKETNQPMPKRSGILTAPRSRFLAAICFALLFIAQPSNAQGVNASQPTITFTNPSQTVRTAAFTLTGTVTASATVNVLAGGSSMAATVTGTDWSLDVMLTDGNNVFTATATVTDAGSTSTATATVTITLNRDLAEAPAITAINTVLNRASDEGVICITFDEYVKFGDIHNNSFLAKRLGDFVVSSNTSPTLTVMGLTSCFVDRERRRDAIQLTLNRQIAFGETATLSYTKTGTKHDTRGIRRDVVGSSEPLANFSNEPIINNAIAPIEGLELRSAGTVSPNQILLSFGLEIITTSSDLRAADFAVSGAASSPTVTAISKVAPSALLLTLDANIVGGETITLSYTKTMGSISSVTAGELVSFDDYSVANNAAYVATTVSKAETNSAGTAIMLTFNRDVIIKGDGRDGGGRALASKFTVTADDVSVGVTNVTVKGKVLTLVLSGLTLSGRVSTPDIRVNYDRNREGGLIFAEIRGKTGGLVSAFNNKPAPVTAPSITNISTDTLVATVGTAIEDITIDASAGGAVTGYVISPPLTAGLTLDTATGTISGTPTEAAGPIIYVITASNSGGSATATVVITVNAAPLTAPSINISTNTLVATVGTAIEDITIDASAGGAVTGYVISPPLTAGLTLDTAIGTISGTPTATASSITYTITATNSAGSATATVAITINAAPPTAPSINISTNTLVATVGTAIEDITIDASAGGAVTGYVISPPLTAGLTLDTATGTVSGTPTAIASLTTYTITATNSGGSATATVVITVNAAPPTAPSINISTNTLVATVGTAIEDITIDASAGGAVTGYVISPPLTAGLTLDTATGTISGTPTATASSRTYTITATNSAGSATAAVAITITLSTGLSAERAKQLNEYIMPNLVQTMLASTISAVSNRVDATFSGSQQVASYQIDGQTVQLDSQTRLSANLQNTVEQKLPSYIKSLKDDAMDWKTMLSRSSFVMPLNAVDGVAAGTGATVWGSGYYNKMSSKFSDGDWKGDVFSIQLGVDQRVRKDLLAGGLVSWSKGDVDYTLNGERRNYTHQITSVHPYFARSSDDGNLWGSGSVGYGQGELAIKQQSPTKDSERNSDTRLLSLSAGVSRQLSQSGQSGLNLKSDMALARTTIVGSADIPTQKISSQRLRLLLEIDKERQLASGGQFKPSVEVGLRYDGGIGDSSGIGAILDMGGRYANTTGLTIQGKLHTSVGQDDYKEWGVQGTIRQQANANGQGLSFSLSPGYGTTGNSANQIWEQKLPDRNSNRDNSARLDVNMGYGLFTGGGLLTPYSEVSMGDSNRYRLGLRWKPNSPFNLHLYGERKASSDSDRILLESTIRF